MSREFHVFDFTKPPLSHQDPAVLLGIYAHYTQRKAGRDVSPVMARVRQFLQSLGWVVEGKLDGEKPVAVQASFNFQGLVETIMPILHASIPGQQLTLAERIRQLMARCQKTDQRPFSHGRMGKKTLDELRLILQPLQAFTQQAIVMDREGYFSCCDRDELMAFVDYKTSKRPKEVQASFRLLARSEVSRRGRFSLGEVMLRCTPKPEQQEQPTHSP